MNNPAKNLVRRIETLLDGRPQKWLAVRSGLTTAKISRILHDGAHVDLYELEGLATAFGLTAVELIAGIFKDRDNFANPDAPSDGDDMLVAWAQSGPVARAVSLYFLTGSSADLKKVHPSIRGEVRQVKEHLSRQEFEFSRKGK